MASKTYTLGKSLRGPLCGIYEVRKGVRRFIAEAVSPVEATLILNALKCYTPPDEEALDRTGDLA